MNAGLMTPAARQPPAEAGRSTGCYLHLMHRKQVCERASDSANGTKLWEASQVLVEASRGIR